MKSIIQQRRKKAKEKQINNRLDVIKPQMYMMYKYRQWCENMLWFGGEKNTKLSKTLIRLRISSRIGFNVREPNHLDPTRSSESIPEKQHERLKENLVGPSFFLVHPKVRAVSWFNAKTMANFLTLSVY